MVSASSQQAHIFFTNLKIFFFSIFFLKIPERRPEVDNSRRE
jgi:hypothetical protein